MKVLILLAILLSCSTALADPSAFAKRLCAEQPREYLCITIRIPKNARWQYVEWNERFKNPDLRRIIMMINRRNILLWNGHTVALPMLYGGNPMEHSPFPLAKPWTGPKHVIVDLKQLAWGAYEPVSKGKWAGKAALLVRWGPANGGSKICKETGRLECKTPVGTYSVLHIDKAGKKSDKYPVDCADKKKCGHPMPYFMKFKPSGEGLHGDRWLVGRNASHGCVRLFKEDAKWLAESFVSVGTPIIIEDY